MPLLPPSEGTFLSLDAVLQHVNTHAQAEGYALVKQRTKKKKGETNKVYLSCDRSSKYRIRNLNPFAKPRLTGTRSTECPFSATATLKDGIWLLTIRSDIHNHEPSYAPIAHPTHRALTDSSKEKISHMSKAGIPPRQIVSTLRSEGVQIKAKDVYNARMQIRAANLGARSPIEAMVDELKVSNYTFSYKQDSEARITHIFFAHPQSLKLLKNYPDVLLLDCTYKTTRFKLPLLNIVGCTCTHDTFYVAFCYMKQETEEDYIWALEQLKDILQQPDYTNPTVIVTDRELALMNAIRVCFPATRGLLCIWHVDQCVKAKANKQFEESEDEQKKKDEFIQAWKRLIRSKKEVDYNREWDRIQDVYSNRPTLLNYLQTTWLAPYKYKIVHCWMDEASHFGHHITSHIEGAHSILKTYLQVFTRDLKFVLDNIQMLLLAQHTEIKRAISNAKSWPGHDLQIELFSDILSKVTPYAL